jgi:site-specific DNA-methyltransferase (cytosine-N4-specific)
MGLLERDASKRGRWVLTGKGRKQFMQPEPKAVLLGFSTDLGVALWASCEEAMSRLDEPISLVLTSPPYCIARSRNYGGPTVVEYIDFITRCMEPLIKALKRGGSICLNVGNDVFVAGSPARSTVNHRLVIALEDRFQLSLMDVLVWVNKSKPPGPIQWASLQRVQLNSAWEPVLWFTNDPGAVCSDNRRVLMEHTERQLKLIRGGGEMRERIHSDGAHRIRMGKSYSRATEGRIPRNVLEVGHSCAGQRTYKAAARELGLPVHGAPMPEKLAEMLIGFLTEKGDLVVDPMAGSFTVPSVAQRMGRRWIGVEKMGEYVRGGAERFRGGAGFSLGEDLLIAMEERSGPQLSLCL